MKEEWGDRNTVHDDVDDDGGDNGGDDVDDAWIFVIDEAF